MAPPSGQDAGQQPVKLPGLAAVWRSPLLLLALGGGAGLSRYMPGTVGTLVAVPIVTLLAPMPSSVFALIVVVGIVAGIAICGRAARRLGIHDHPAIVFDEIVGYAVALCWLPLEPRTLLLAFILFRIADILKPWPANLVDKRLHGGFGIMLDDVIAGLYANLALQLIVRYV